MTTYADKLHDVIRLNIKNGNLSNMTNRLYFDSNIREFIDVHTYDNPEMAFRTIETKYISLYKPLILDQRFEFRIKSADNIGVYAVEDIYHIGRDIFVGAFTQHLSEEASMSHPSCVERQLSQRSNLNRNKSRLNQFWILIGSIALLNHGCNNCSDLKPFDADANNESEHYSSSYRVVTQIRPILSGRELCISYSDYEVDIRYSCSICNH